MAEAGIVIKDYQGMIIGAAQCVFQNVRSAEAAEAHAAEAALIYAKQALVSKQELSWVEKST